MKSNNVVRNLEKRKAKLINWLENHPTDDYTDDEKVADVKSYLAELEGLISSVSFIEKEIYLVTKSTLETKSQKADFATVDEEGYFFQLLLVQNFPYSDIYLLYLAPLNNL